MIEPLDLTAGANIGVFFVQEDDEPNRIYLEVGGLTVLVNATEEGVIVDVLPLKPRTDGNDVLATLGVMYSEAFEENSDEG